jgi:predicted DNA-binding protein YlxM (UPF0122 family)
VIRIVSDFYNKDSIFALQIIAGKYSRSLTNVHDYIKSAETELEEEIDKIFEQEKALKKENM